MPEVIIKFNLPEEYEQLNDALHATQYKRVIEEVFFRLRRIDKSADSDKITTQDVRDIILEEMQIQQVTLE